VNANDYFLIDTAFLGQGAPLASAAATASTRTTSAVVPPVLAKPQQKARKRAVRPIFADELVAASRPARRI
jgi:hypothetical protein